MDIVVIGSLVVFWLREIDIDLAYVRADIAFPFRGGGNQKQETFQKFTPKKLASEAFLSMTSQDSRLYSKVSHCIAPLNL